jgi:ArsR family transcriptional regulator
MDLIRFTKVLKALSDPTRLEIVALLSFRPHCVCELVNIIGFSQPTISRHLRC